MMNRRTALYAISSGLVIPNFSNATGMKSLPHTTINQGKIYGKWENGVAVFRGVPYAVLDKNQRFSPPRDAPIFNKPFYAYEYGASCPQSNSSEPNQNEDCLFLNIWAPQKINNGRKRPVMLYIHGGAYNNGSGSDELYNGTNLCLDGDVVIITINHRLNAFGYLFLAQLERNINGNNIFKYSGNAGQLDIIHALWWVKNNIAAFGGDPDNIMLFGQSGGGAKIATLMATPAADGLFHSAATMSGQQVTASGINNATQRTKTFLNALNLKANENGLRLIQTVPVNDIIAALKATDPIIGSGGLYMGPVYDNAVLFRHPFYPDAAPQGCKIPMIIGNTKDETRAFLQNSPDRESLDWDKLARVIAPQYRVDIDPQEVITKYRQIYPNYNAEQIYFAATTAGRSWRGAIIEAEERARANAPAYVYQLNWQSPKDGGKWGACHTMDIPLVFMNTAAPNALSGNDKGAQDMAKIMAQSFIAFAHNKTPNNPNIPHWEKYGLGQRETMIFDLPPRMENDPRSEERKLFNKVPFTQQGS